MTSSRKLTARCITSAAAIAALTAVTTPSADAIASHQAPSGVTLEFVKNFKDPSHSVLRVYDGKNKTLVNKFRAGSGLGTAADYDSHGNLTARGKRYRNDCVSEAGWLPNGTYKPTSFEINRDQKIKGYAIGLPSRKCRANGTRRTALFIHSEMTKDRKQGPRAGADSPYRWEGPRDYKSNGCIKLRPEHIAWLFSYMNKHGRATSLVVR